jgi:hypothetical protein
MTHERPAAISRIVNTDEVPLPADYEAWFELEDTCWYEEQRVRFRRDLTIRELFLMMDRHPFSKGLGLMHAGLPMDLDDPMLFEPYPLD